MEKRTEVRHRVLTGELSKRAACQDYGTTRVRKAPGPRTINAKLIALTAFGSWLVDSGRLIETTLTHYLDPRLLDLAGAVLALPAIGLAGGAVATMGEESVGGALSGAPTAARGSKSQDIADQMQAAASDRSRVPSQRGRSPPCRNSHPFW